MDQMPNLIIQAKKDVENAEEAMNFQENLSQKTERKSVGNIEQEKKLREDFNFAIGKLNRAENIFKNSEEIISYWESKLEFGFEELLEDSQRVANGGTSSWALRRKSTKNIEGEEE